VTAASSQWEGFPRSLLAILAVFVLLFVGAYRLAVPLVATAIADRLPQAVPDAVGTVVLESFDRTMFEASALPAERQRQLVAAFDRLQLPNASGIKYRVLFRKATGMGPNAMALPSGAMIVTDALVELARDDREILGVLAHEAGHVDRRHGLRLVVQNSALSFVIGWFIGDFNSVLAHAPAALLEAKYSRDLEREADAFAVDVLRANGISVKHLAAMLERLERSQSEARAAASMAYLSTHPATKERIDALRDQP
jgi:Zn-dependent protease with chaperone function